MHISIWEQESFFAHQDVIIIGGGLTGLWCAYELLSQNPSLALLILDRGIIPAGASTRNAGFACFGSPTELLHDAQQIGDDQMWQLTEMRYKGIQKIRRIFSDQLIDFDNCGGYECLRRDSNDIEKITEDLFWLNNGISSITGNKNTFAISTERLAEFNLHGFDALIENKLEGGLHSGKLVLALQRKIQSMGAQIRQGIDVVNWEENNNTITVYTKQNIYFSSSQLLLCTNALSPDLLPGISLSPARGQIIVTKPVSDLAMRGTFHFDEGFYYFRNIGNRVLLGGARNKAFAEEAGTDFNITNTIQQNLEAFLSTHILPGQSYNIEYRWGGIMGFTDNKQPLVKQLSENVIAVLLCNGMGVALSPMIAEEISLLLR